MERKKKQGTLFGPEHLAPTASVLLVRPPRRPLWTEHKARLISRYLRYFVLVTKHGTYIDGFAGPQEDEHEDMWSARLVLQSEPRWLRHFYLCDLDPEKVKRLEALKKEQPPRAKKEPKRSVEILPGDFNTLVIEKLIKPKAIKPKDAAFCLLDQRTLECHWETVRALASYKQDGGHKIEIFYFLANHWLPRTLAALQDHEKADLWWGSKDWTRLQDMRAWDRAKLLSERFKTELGYKSAMPWAIYERQSGGHIMYFMLHATDHPAAPGLMRRAYERAVRRPEPMEQLDLESLLRPPRGH